MDKKKEGLSRFSVESFSSHSTRKFCRGILQCVTIFQYRKTLGIRKVGLESRVSVEIVLSHWTETFRGGNPLCCVAEVFLQGIWIRRRGVSRYPVENVLSHKCQKVP